MIYLHDLYENFNKKNISKFIFVSNVFLQEYNNHIYKLYINDINTSIFSQIRHYIKQFYYEKYENNIIWQIKTLVVNDKIYQIQKKQIFKICNNIDEQTLINTENQIFTYVQKKLKFSILTKMLKLNNYNILKNLKHIKLIRDQVIKNSDFGMYNSDYILLDDDQFTFILLDNNNNIIKLNNQILLINDNLYLKKTYNIYWCIIEETEFKQYKLDLDINSNKKIKINNKQKYKNICANLKNYNQELSDLQYIQKKNGIIYLFDKNNNKIKKHFNFYKIKKNYYLSIYDEDYCNINVLIQNIQQEVTSYISEWKIYKIKNAQELYSKALKNNQQLTKRKLFFQNFYKN